MKDHEIKKLIELINFLAEEIREIKERECENSGKNWYDKFIREVPDPSFFNHQ